MEFEHRSEINTMICLNSFFKMAFLGLIVVMLLAAPVFSSDQSSVACIDISSPTASRVLELVATPINEKYFSLAGSHRNSAGATVGTADGTAALVGNEVLVTVNASYDYGSTVGTVGYQFKFNLSTTFGTFKSITQQNINGAFTPLNYRSGEASLISCDEPLTSFTDGPTTSDCFDNDMDGYTCFNIGGRDCNDNDAYTNPSATEICGDGIDQDCDGIVDENCNYPTFINNGNGTLSQVDTNLVWQQTSYNTNASINWTSAMSYCENLTLGGFFNWRLPTRSELENIIDNRGSPLMIDPMFVGTQSTFYWTSTIAQSPLDNAFVVNFSSGSSSVKHKLSTNRNVRCVSER